MIETHFYVYRIDDENGVPLYTSGKDAAPAI
jgi:hypothetical protein